MDPVEHGVDALGSGCLLNAQAQAQAQAEAQAEVAFQEGVMAQAQGERAAARAHFERALAVWPGCAAAWSNLGLLHADAGEPEAAQACYEQALKLDPSLFEATLNLATVRAERLDFDAAEALFQQALRLRPESPEAWSNLGGLLASTGRLDDALACCWQALKIDPGHPKARFNLSYPLLRQGRYAEGFLCLEARDASPAVLRLPEDLRWLGDPLGGRGLLVVSDAGHGDVIQLARYAQTLRAQGAGRLIFQGQAGLQRLLADSGLWDRVLRFEDPLPPADAAGFAVWTPLMSLPHLCQSRLDDLPAALPYLRADAQRQADWRERLLRDHPGDVLRIGLVWRGNPRHENDAQRSMPHLRTLAALSAVPGIRCHSLQSGAGADDVDDPPPGLPLARLDAPLGDFAQTAALIVNLDLVIGVDTSVVHLAGALGVPVWVLLSHHKPDWRWLDARSDSPWYPGVMRLFRQPSAGAWAAVLADVTQALVELRARTGASPAA